MSVFHAAQVYTEMINDQNYKKLVAKNSPRAFSGWELSKKEKALLVSEARLRKAKLSPSESPVLNYLIANQPLSQPVGAALANAIARQMGKPILGPLAGDCDGGCCSWTSRIIFGGDPAPRND